VTAACVAAHLGWAVERAFSMAGGLDLLTDVNPDCDQQLPRKLVRRAAPAERHVQYERTVTVGVSLLECRPHLSSMRFGRLVLFSINVTTYPRYSTSV
jgi:hypothetical protein